MAAVELWLLRHGDAADGEDDAARPLTPKGEAQAAAAAQALVVLGKEFLAVFASPRVRARDTAAPVAEALGLELQIHEPLHGGFDPGDVAQLLLSLERAGRVVLVGHEPDFSALVEHMTGAQIDLKKGGLAVVRLDDEDVNQLIVLLRPAELKLIAG